LFLVGFIDELAAFGVAPWANGWVDDGEGLGSEGDDFYFGAYILLLLISAC
jgi:hypothetical protein